MRRLCVTGAGGLGREELSYVRDIRCRQLAHPRLPGMAVAVGRDCSPSPG